MTTFQTSTLRPGLLVGLKTSVSGNVHYAKRVVEADHVTGDGARKARWETERTITDPEEHERAGKVRNKARALIAGVCANSAFGLLCPETARENLGRAVAEARKLADDFNATAQLTRVTINVIAGRIAADDVEAVRAINSELRDLLESMEDGVRNLDAKAVRDAASRARSLGAMLSPNAQARVRTAIDAARAAATKIVKAGEQSAQEIDLQAVRTITEARTAFLDLDPEVELKAPTFEARALDLSEQVPLSPAEKSWATRRQRALEVE